MVVTDTWLVVCEVPDGSKYVSGAFYTQVEAERYLRQNARNASNYYIVQYNPDSYAD